jgi:uncharacterized protein
MSKLRIADNLTLPTDAVTQTFAILAKRGVGKTYCASVMAEEMLKAGQTVIALDPTGAWWGLRSGFPVVIFGGEHADVPLEESAGEIVAKAIVEHRFPAVLDLSLFRKGQMIRFMVAFAETLYRLNREPVHLFVDEADAVAPQGRTYGGEENRMLGAMEDIVRRGRKRGIGSTLITQRPAVLNKNVLTQCEVLIALRLVHPKDIDAVREWVNVHADPDRAQQMEDSLPSLPIGDAWFWSPGWGDIFKRVHVRERETFDSGATPKPGETARKPKHLERIDLNALGEQIKATVERTKADDPKELRKRIADLERQLKGRPAETKTVEVEKIIEVPVLKNGQLDRTEKVIGRLEAIGEKVTSEAAELRRLIVPAFQPRPTSIPQSTPRSAKRAFVATPAPKPSIASSTPVGDVTHRQQRFLDAAATLTTLGVEVTRETVAAWVGVHPRGGSVGEELKALADAGFIEMDRGRVMVTEAGMAVANCGDPAEAIERAKSGLTNRQRRFFDLIVSAYPGDTTREEIAAAVGIHPRGGSLGEDLGRLVGRGLVDGQRGRYRARDFLFAGT